MLDAFTHLHGSPGLAPTRVVLPTFLTPERYDPLFVTYNMDASKFWNAAWMWFMFGAYSSGVPQVTATPPTPSINPLNYDPATQVYSLDASKFWNAVNMFTFGAY